VLLMLLILKKYKLFFFSGFKYIWKYIYIKCNMYFFLFVLLFLFYGKKEMSNVTKIFLKYININNAKRIKIIYIKYAKIYLCNFIIILINNSMLDVATTMSVLQVLAITIPVLLTVAFATVAERKTMASMQRRLGPNIVGIKNITCTLRCNKFYTNYTFTNYIHNFSIRHFHTSNSYCSNNKKILDSLLISSLSTVKPFNHLF